MENTRRYDELFKVNDLNHLTFKHFKIACIAAMAQPEELKGIIGMPCGAEYLLYRGEGKSLITVRNWGHMLSLHIQSASGIWIASDHIEGMGLDGVIQEAYRRVMVAKPYIDTLAKRAFGNHSLSVDAISNWLNEYSDKFKNKEDVL